MIFKAFRFLVFNVVALLSFWATAHADAEQQIFPLPVTETEDVVVRWFQRTGYHLRRATVAHHGVRIFALKGSRRWQITLWPHSPLATRVEASHASNASVQPSALKNLWFVLDNHVKTMRDHDPEDRLPAIPTQVLSNAESVVCIYVGYPEKPLQISGFIIDKKGLIICTAHGLKNVAQPLTVTLRNGRELPGRVVKIDKRYDLSLVDVGTELDAYIALSHGRDLLGGTERLFNIVCATNSNGTIYSGNISGPPRKSNHQVLWQVNMQIRPGSSGSPVFDLQGNLVAVVKGRYRGADTVGFLIPFASVMKFLGDD
jgi:serine protease Do